MLETIFWILAIIIMLELISIETYKLVMTIKEAKELEKYKSKQKEMLNKLVEKYESEDK